MTTQGVGRTALVTGASAGIGKAFAELLAAHGYDLVIAARREDRLQAIAAELAAAHGRRVHVVAANLGDPQAPARLLDEIHGRGLDVDVLVNNAGYGVPGRYLGTAWTTQAEALQVMVTAVCELTHRVLPGMVARKWGRILNIASLAALMPAAPGHTVYAATKAFLVKFSEALAGEVRADGVHVTAVCPGFTLTEFHDVAGTRQRVSALPDWMWQDAASVAREGYDAVMAGQAVVVTGRVNRALAAGAKYLPEPVAKSVVSRNAKRFRKL